MFWFQKILVLMMVALSLSVGQIALADDGLQQRIANLYDKIFADPGNVSLNLELVRSQMQVRDYKGASGTLERLLIISPNNKSAKLLMAQVKIALRNVSEAKLLLDEILSSKTLDGRLRTRAQELSEQLDKASDGLSWQAVIAVNSGLSQNPENKPSKTSYSLYLPTTPIEVSGASQAFRGSTLSGTIERRFNSYDARKLRLDLAHQRRDYNSYNKSDYEVYSASVAAIKGDEAPLGGTLKVLRVRVREKDFMDQIGLESQKQIRTPFGFDLAGAAYLGRQIHREHVNFSGNKQKTGMVSRLSLAGTVMLGKKAVKASLDFDRKQASLSRYSYHQTKLRFDTNIPLFGLSFLGQASLVSKRYDAAGMVYSTRRRHDKTANLAVEVLLPLGNFIASMPEAMRVSMRGDVNRTASNIRRFNTTKSEVMLKASYAWQGR